MNKPKQLQDPNIDIENDEDRFNEGHFYPIKDVRFGIYSEHTFGLYEIEMTDDERESILTAAQYYHVWAVEFFLGKSIEELMQNKTMMMSDLYDKMWLVRRNPGDLLDVGRQHKHKHEIKAMLALNERINVYLKEELEKMANEEEWDEI